MVISVHHELNDGWNTEMSNTPNNALVWFEIPVSDLGRATTFYNTVLDCELTRDENGPNPMAMFPVNGDDSVAGHLYEGEPASGGNGSTVHLAIKDKLEAAAERCATAGGKVMGEAIEIPAGRFQYALDPDGNSISLFESAA